MLEDIDTGVLSIAETSARLDRPWLGGREQQPIDVRTRCKGDSDKQQ